ncbi:hypothetical protein Dsin_027706 [Dipteronia sinensis]|uniref:Uncharacterized protein n=1 Tax=Dipteronia sinensis TaxID=43782 RepID=A0AAD9ZP73_9ROSI|nr:hypothetical protein Dsin_027706 [Dipteronia sinensis]
MVKNLNNSAYNSDSSRERFAISSIRCESLEKRKIHTVDWDTIYESKKCGGLGVGKISDQNKSHLAKWLWRISRETNSLWKRVLCAKYGRSVLDLRWDWNCSRSCSFFVKAVLSLCEADSATATILNNGLKVVVGMIRAELRGTKLKPGVLRPPPSGIFKFNVDGSVRGSPGQAGMGGVLRNWNGTILCLFSCFLDYGRVKSNSQGLRGSGLESKLQN